MSSNNPSAPYGYYGSVAPGDVYFPPKRPQLTSLPRSVPFTQQDLENLRALTSSEEFKQFLKTNAGAIALRHLQVTQTANKTFEINTLNDLGEPITYTTALSTITIAVTPTTTPTQTATPTETIISTPTATPEGYFPLPPTPEATETPTPTPAISPTPSPTPTPTALIFFSGSWDDLQYWMDNLIWNE